MKKYLVILLLSFGILFNTVAQNSASSANKNTALRCLKLAESCLVGNDWQNALMYITSDNKKPLQLLLVNIQKSIEFLLNNNNVPASVRAAMGGGIPQYSSTMATVIVVIGPIMIVYPFFQKYFIKGLTVGSVKG